MLSPVSKPELIWSLIFSQMNDYNYANIELLIVTVSWLLLREQKKILFFYLVFLTFTISDKENMI